jgi:hypothetical protein
VKIRYRVNGETFEKEAGMMRVSDYKKLTEEPTESPPSGVWTADTSALTADLPETE